MAAGMQQLQMLQVVRNEIVRFDPDGKKYDVEPLGSTTLMRMDELACACLDALDPRLGEQAVRKEFSLVVKRFTAEAFKQHQAFGVFGGVEAMQAGARAADMLERTEKK